MTSHIHLIVSVKDGCDLASIIRDFKTFTSKEFIKTIIRINESRREWLLNKFSFEATRKVRGKNYKVWQDGYHAIELINSEMVNQKLAYIHNNPVTECIVDEEDHYIYSSARQYANKIGQLNIELL